MKMCANIRTTPSRAPMITPESKRNKFQSSKRDEPNNEGRDIMSITTRNGIYMPAMSQAKAFSESGNQISKPEAQRLVSMMKNALINEYEGATSERGLAGDRNVLARTAKAIFKNAEGKWGMNAGAKAVFREAFGSKLDGKSGTIADLESKIRNQVRTPQSTGYTYWG
jgi:hypothetical protein